MRTIDTSYYCCTPYQMITSVNLALNSSETADLYVIDLFDHAEEYADKIRGLGIFQEVKLVREKDVYEHYTSDKHVFLNHLGIAWSYLHVDRIAAKILIPDTCYGKMFFSSRAYISRMVQLFYNKHKTDVEILYFDDGEGSYDNLNTYVPSKADSLVRFILFGKKSIDTEHTKYLYRPDLYFSIHPESKEDIVKIPPIEIGGRMNDIINHIFDITEEKLINKRVIILDTTHNTMSEDQMSILTESYDLIVDYFGKENVIVKKHPRDRGEKLLDCEYYEDNSIPFECLCLNMDLSNTVLVALTSTALVLPKLLFDKEPAVMMFCGIPEFGSYSEIQMRYYNEIKKLYVKDSLFMIPKDVSEINLMLNAVQR